MYAEKAGITVGLNLPQESHQACTLCCRHMLASRKAPKLTFSPSTADKVIYRSQDIDHSQQCPYWGGKSEKTRTLCACGCCSNHIGTHSLTPRHTQTDPPLCSLLHSSPQHIMVASPKSEVARRSSAIQLYPSPGAIAAGQTDSSFE